jgi:O-antigen ligase
MILDALRLAFLATVLLGGASLERLGDSFGELGALGEARFVGLLLVATALVVIAPGLRARPSPPRLLTAWLLLLAVLHALVAASWLWSDRTPYAKAQLLDVALTGVVVALAAVLFRETPERGIHFTLVSFYVAALLFVLASLALSGGLAGEITGVGAGAIGSARILCMGVIAAIWLMRDAGRRGWLLLLPTPLMLAGAVAGGSRAAVLALAFALGVSWLRWSADGASRQAIEPPSRAAAAGVAGLVSLSILALPFTRALGQLWLQQLLTPAGAAGGVYLAGRDVIFADAWRQFSANALGGLGIGSYIGPFGEQYPHNLLLSYAIDAGAVALLCAVVAIGAGFRGLLGQRTAPAGAALSAATFFAVTSCFAGSYYDARFLWIFLLFGLALREPRGARAGVIRFVRAGETSRSAA